MEKEVLSRFICDDKRHCITSGVCFVVTTELNLGAENQVISLPVVTRKNMLSF